MSIEEHLAHLVALITTPPFHAAWKLYAWQRARELAADPELADLPNLLAEAMKK